MFELNNVRGNARCTKQHIRALQGNVATTTEYSLNQFTEVP